MDCTNGNLLLKDSDYIRFVPVEHWNSGTDLDNIDFNGMLTFKAWDQTNGLDAGCSTDQINDGTVNTLSDNEADPKIIVTPVNDSPCVGGSECTNPTFSPLEGIYYFNDETINALDEDCDPVNGDQSICLSSVNQGVSIATLINANNANVYLSLIHI